MVERHGALTIVFRRMESHRAAVLFRRGELDVAPVPLGDIRAALTDPTVARSVHVRRLNAVDALVLSGVPAAVRRVLDETADRTDYALLVPEDPDAAVTSPPARVFRAAKRRIAKLPHVSVRIAIPADPTLRYGASLLVAAWRDLGLDVRLVDHDANARFVRRTPRAGIRIAHAVDARFVSPRVRGWREDARGVVDYSRVTLDARR